MAQYVGRKSISKNIPKNIPAISYKYSSKYPHNRLLENHDLMLLRKRFLVKIDVVSNEPLWHSILRADAASYLGNCFVQKKKHCDENQASIKRSYVLWPLPQRRPTCISSYCLLAIVFTSALNMLWWNDFDCTPVHNTVWHHVHILFSPSLRVTKQMTLAINCITHTYSQSHSRTYKRDTCFQAHRGYIYCTSNQRSWFFNAIISAQHFKDRNNFEDSY